MPPPVCCGRARVWTVWTGRPLESSCGSGFRRQTTRTSILLDDLMGIGDPDVALPQIDPDARRRRLAAMVKAAVIARTTPTVYVIEDAHWIDEVSESMLAELLTVVPRTRSLVIVTYRPEYAGALAHAPRSQTIALEPLDESQMLALGAELLGEDRSVTELAELIAERAAGNPFFAEEIVRDLSERDVLVGGRGCYLCVDPVGDVHVPGTLQAVIAARIDRLDPAAKRTLNAAAVIGSRFTPDMLQALGVETALGDLVSAELIDQTAFSPRPEYAFRHPLIRAVAYESQLKSDRAQLHGRVAATLDQTRPERCADRRAFRGRRGFACRLRVAYAGRSVVDQSRPCRRSAQLGARAPGSRCVVRRRAGRIVPAHCSTLVVM